jgi:hypothetical protein
MGVFCVRKRGPLSMTHGSHANVERAGFVRTPPTIAQQCRELITIPDHDLFSVGDLTCGNGDFLFPFLQPNAHMIGTELSRDRAEMATELRPGAAIYATALEHSPNVGLGLCDSDGTAATRGGRCGASRSH